MDHFAGLDVSVRRCEPASDIKHQTDWSGNINAHHIGTLAGKSVGRRGPGPSGGTGDNDGLAVKPS
jgi:hypothetical protein